MARRKSPTVANPAAFSVANRVGLGLTPVTTDEANRPGNVDAAPPVTPSINDGDAAEFFTRNAGDQNNQLGLVGRGDTRESEGPSWGAIWEAAKSNDWIVAAWARQSVIDGYEVDPEYRTPDFDSPDWKALTEGVPLEYQENLYNARSLSHAYMISATIKEELANEQLLAEAGGWGLAGRLAAGVTDPVALSLAVATGGLGAVPVKAQRLYSAARAARMAGNLTEASAGLAAAGAAMTGRTAGNTALRLGAIGAAENMAIEAVLVANSQTRDTWDIAHAGLAGFALTAGISRIFTGAELRAMEQSFTRERSILQMMELEEAIELRRAQLVSRADGADIARAQELRGERAALQAETRQELEAVEAELAQVRAAMKEAADPARLRQRGSVLEGEVRAMDARIAREGVPEEKAIRRRSREVEGATRELKDIEREIRKLSKKQPDNPFLPQLDARRQDIVGRRARAEGELNRVRQLARLPADRAAKVRELGVVRRALFEPKKLEVDRLGLEARKGQIEASAKAREADIEAELQRLAEPNKAAEELEGLDALAAGARSQIGAMANKRGDWTVRAGGSFLDRYPNNPGATAAVTTFGSDTGGAARATGSYEHLNPGLVEAIGNEGIKPGMEVGQQAFGRIMRKIPGIRNFSSVLRGSPDAWVRNKLGIMIADSVSTADGSVNRVGASEVAARLQQTFAATFYSAVDAAYPAWVRASKSGMGISRETRSEFMSLVGRAIRGEKIDDPNVNKLAAATRGIFADYLKEAKAAGVAGFDAIPSNPNYLPRVVNHLRMFQAEQQYGTGTIVNFFDAAIRQAMPDMPEDLAMRMAKGYVTRMKKLRIGADHNAMHGFPLDDMAYLREVLRESGETDDVIEDVVTKLRAWQADKGDEQGGTIRYAKRRLQLDETFVGKVVDQQKLRETGQMETVELRMSDLLENDVEHLFARYNRTLSGHIGMAKQAGIRSVGDFQKLIKEIKERYEADPKEAELLVRYAENAYKLVVGQPIEDSGDLQRALKLARDFNFMTTMNAAGWAQIPDLAGLFAAGNLRHTLKMSGLGRVMRSLKRDEHGRLTDPLARELEGMVGIGTDFHNNAVFASYENVEGDFGGKLGKFEHGVRLGGRVTSVISGMSFANTLAARMAAQSITSRIMREALEGGEFSAKRLADLGFDSDLMARVGDQLRRHAVDLQDDAGSTVKSPNWVAWDDLEARDAFLYGIQRYTNRIVQREDIGDTTLWMNTGIGKVLAQFRRFAIVSMSKQILHGANHLDAETATRVALSMALAGFAYWLQYELKAASMGPEESKKFREQYLTGDRIVAAAYARSSFSGLLPGMMDTITASTIGERYFDVRASGQASDLITGNPTFALVNNLGTVGSTAITSVVREDVQWTQRDAKALRRIMPWQNFMPLDYMVNPAIEELPKTSVDENPDEIDFSLF